MAGPAFRAAAVRVRVPATSANLGPGFDAFGLALGLYDDVVVRVADSGLSVDIAGEGADNLARDERHLVVRSMRAAFERLGGQPRGLEVVCANRIPHGRGLGSSSAAICAGIVAARAVTIGGNSALDDDALLDLASEIEGHPDNVAACLRGNFTVAWTAEDGAHTIVLDPSDRVVPVVFVPATEVLTATARGLLPKTVPLSDAAVNAGRAALLVEALTRRPELLLTATEDRLHQDYRASAMPDSAALVAALRAQGCPPSSPAPAPPCWPSPTRRAPTRSSASPDPSSPRTGWSWTAPAPASCRSTCERKRHADGPAGTDTIDKNWAGECVRGSVVLTSMLHQVPSGARCAASRSRPFRFAVFAPAGSGRTGPRFSGSPPRRVRSLPARLRRIPKP